ncbi:MAG: SUMF1/EgtB/PvdO family nonheme iron enzyme, partial [Planctomycetota bacterium]
MRTVKASLLALLIIALGTSIAEGDLVAFWHFEEADGDFVADSVGGHHGTASANIVPSADVPGPPLGDYPPDNVRSRIFPGAFAGGRIEIPDHDDLDLTGGFTIELWMKQEDPENNKLLCKHKSGVNTDGSWQLEVRTSFPLQMDVYPASGGPRVAVSDPGVLPTGEWVHVAFTYDESSDRYEYYVNGLSAGGGTFGIAGLIQNTIRPLYFGAQEGDSAHNVFSGNMDEIQIWNECRTQEQVQEDMVASIPEPPCGPEMVCIPGGEFLMGDHHDGMGQSLPVHAVYIDSFCMSRYEVSNQQYCDYLNAAISQEPPLIEVNAGSVYAGGGSLPYCDTHSYDGESQIDYSAGVFSVRTKDGIDMSDHPMVEVSWYGAIAYCDYYCYRLPTEAEWEYAARGGEHDPYYRYPWGDSIDGSKANYWNSGDACETGTQPWTTPVGDYSANGYGLYDVIGNVWEWCSDWFDTGYYSVSPYDNPQGPATGTYPVCRGCSWGSVSDPAASCRVATRNAAMPHAREYHLGFRVVRGESTGPVAYWPFDGDAIDATGNGHNGIVHGATLCEDRCLVPDGAHCFDGIDDEIVVPYDPAFDLADQITIGAWVKRGNIEDRSPIISKGADMPGGTINYELFIESDGTLSFGFWVPGWHVAYSNSKIADTQWHHVAVTYDRAQICLYIDGSADSTTPDTTAMTSNVEPIGMGIKFSSWPFHYLEGKLDEVRIYDRALSACEIAELIEDCPMPVRVEVDVKPGGCPNPLNLKSRGVLPVAVLGTEEFDASAIDPASIRLAGVAPVRSGLEDVSASVADGNECDCTETGADGFVDLTLKFKTPEIVEELLITHGELARGDVLELILTGNLSDGTF